MSTNPNPDRCTQLRKLHSSLTDEVKALRESVNNAEKEGADTSMEALKRIKHLQASLYTISLELEKCPPVPEEATSAVKATRDVLQWRPEGVEDNDPEFESVIDEP